MSGDSKQEKTIKFHTQIRDVFNRKSTTSPPSKISFLIYSPNAANFKIVQVDEYNLCIDVSLDAVIKAMDEYSENVLGVKMTARAVRDCAQLWYYSTKPTVQPKPVRFLNEDCLAYAELPFDICSHDGTKHPVFDEMFSRMTNAEAVKAWIGSLFIEGSYRQQYVWLYGKGHDGKGSLARFLMRVLGNSAVQQSQAPNEWSNKHWAVPYENKRLIVFSDYAQEKGGTIRTGALKSLTGGDPIYVDPKGKPGYMIEPTCKILFLSNELPELVDNIADMRRIIFAGMETTIAETEGYQDLLLGEGGYFLWTCIQEYNRLCPTNIRIPQIFKDPKHIYNSVRHEEFERILEVNFLIDIQASPSELVTPKDAQDICSQYFGKSRQKWADFLTWLDNKHGVRNITYRINGHISRRLKSLKLPS